MARILSYHNPTPKQLKENLFKYLWGEFTRLDKFTKRLIVVFLLIILTTPFIVNQYQIFTGRAQQVPVDWNKINTIYYASTNDNAHSLLLLVKDIKAQLEPVLGRTLETKNTGPNLALGKTKITSSVAPTGSGLEVLTDGFTDLSLDGDRRAIYLYASAREKVGQWIQLDMEEPVLITKINIRRIYDTTVVSSDAVVQLSTDGNTWTTIFNNDGDNSMGQGAGNANDLYNESPSGKDIALVTPIEAQYIRSWSNIVYEQKLNPYTELEVYGSYVSPPPAVSNGIILEVDPDNADLSGKKKGAFKLLTDDKGVHITGKTTISMRNGVYRLLEKLGYRWYWADPAWHVKPATLENISLNEIQEPFFNERRLFYHTSDWNQEKPGGPQKGIDWFVRNQLISDEAYGGSHTYSSFVPLAEIIDESIRLNDPTMVCNKNGPYLPVKLRVNPDHPIVVARAIKYARERLSGKNLHFAGDIVDKMIAPISPDDGGLDWCWSWRDELKDANGNTVFHQLPVLGPDGKPTFNPDGTPVLYPPTPVMKQNQQTITDHVFGLTNKVAIALKDEFPGKYISVYSYSVYPNVTSFDLEDNVYVVVAFGGGSRSNTLTDADRVAGFSAMGQTVGIHEYYDVWNTHKDRIPSANVLKSKISSMDTARDNGADNFYSEIIDSWASKGRLIYATAKKMWDANLKYEDILEDFYTNAFGPAKEPMKRMYTRFDTQWAKISVQNKKHPIMGLAFRDLNEALRLTEGRPEVQARIWQVFYHTYWWWKWGDDITTGYSFDDIDDAKNFYTFLFRQSSMHLISGVNYRLQSTPYVQSKTGMTDLSGLVNTTRPTLEESQQWLAEVLNNWAGIDLIDPVAFILDYNNLAAANSNLPKQNANGYFQGARDFHITLPSSGNEIINIEARTHTSGATLEFVAPNGLVLDTRILTQAECYRDTTNPCKWQVTTTIPGVYEIRDIEDGAVSIRLDHSAAMDLTRGGKTTFFDDPDAANQAEGDEQEAVLGKSDGMRRLDGTPGFTLYFYVPSGTKSFVLSFTTEGMDVKAIDPDGQSYSLMPDPLTGKSGYNGFKDPKPGIWKLDYLGNNNTGTLVMTGIPPLLWHDPKQMLIPGSGPVQDTPTPTSVVSTTPTAVPPTPTPGDTLKKNIVLILTDDQRWDTLFAMPILQEKLVKKGVLFTNSFVTTPVCCPSRSSLLSGGNYPHSVGILVNGLPNGGAKKPWNDFDTLGVNLQKQGYKTALIGKYLNEYDALAPYVPPGWTKWIGESKRRSWTDHDVVIGSSTEQPSQGTIVTQTQYTTDYFKDQTIAFIEQSNDPFFVIMTPFAPHSPATAAAGDENLFSDFFYRGRAFDEKDLDDKPGWVKQEAWTIEPKNLTLPQKQLRSLQAVDRAIGAIVDKLETLGKLENTVIIFTSDNGLMWGEHRLFGSKGKPYEESIRVPLVIRMPGNIVKTEDKMTVSNLDVGSTIYDIAGIQGTSDGLSLLPLLRGEDIAWRQNILIENFYPLSSESENRPQWAGIRTPEFKYIEYPSGEKEFYDLTNDPFEMVNQQSNPSFQTTIGKLNTLLEQSKGLQILTEEIPDAIVGKEYFFQLQAWGGAEPYFWSIEKRALPQGLSLNQATGAISGVPLSVDEKNPQIQVQDASSNMHSKTSQKFIKNLTIAVQNVSITPTPTPAKVTVQGRHVDENGNVLTTNIGQSVILNDGLLSDTTSLGAWDFSGINPDIYTVTANLISGYTISHSICLSCAPPIAPYTLGDTATVDLLQGGTYADIYFKYTPILTSTPVPPTPTRTPSPTLPPGVTPTITPIPTATSVPPTPTPIPCSLVSASWSTATATEGQTITLNVTGNSSCIGKQVDFEVRENDSLLEGGIDEPVSLKPLSAVFAGTNTTTIWIAEWQEDGLLGIFNPPEYFFKASLTGDQSINIRSSDPLLEVTKTVEPAKLSITSGPTVTVTQTGATITWGTNKEALSRVTYGVSKDSARREVLETSTLSHAITVNGLDPCAIYHYRADSKSGLEEIQSEISKFITLGCDASIIAEVSTDKPIDLSQDGVLVLVDSLSGKGIILEIPSQYSLSALNFQMLQFNRQEYVTKISLPTGFTNAGGHIYRLNAFGGVQEARISEFIKPLVVKMTYSDADLQNIKEDTLTIQKWNGTNWIKLENCVLDKGNKEVSCETTSFSDFMLVGELAPTPTPTIEPTPTEVPGTYNTPSTYGTPSDGGYNTPSSYGTPSYGTPSAGGTTGDLNSDGKVNIFDLSILLRNWNKSGQGDLNSDGKVNIFDLSILLRGWK